ncbi:NAD-dependent epimerase/dehydratase [Planoprotostelium fungivorum]|uniref:NAD-dependent epimerase/dehydratase n=1 Tax=Planoprotostelium fungivorum TaxID=1890364 RepID=A0A2P6NL11_9EUKA|nr:NAD-dependent epimerase/dehydratase [Planoprotostelium fungivorum]
MKFPRLSPLSINKLKSTTIGSHHTTASVDDNLVESLYSYDHLNNLEEPESLRSAVERTDVIHSAFNHENIATRFAQSAAGDLAVTKFIGELLKGSNKPFIITHGLLVAKSGIELLEADAGESTGFAAIRAEPVFLLISSAIAFMEVKLLTTCMRLPAGA